MKHGKTRKKAKESEWRLVPLLTHSLWPLSVFFRVSSVSIRGRFFLPQDGIHDLPAHVGPPRQRLVGGHVRMGVPVVRGAGVDQFDEADAALRQAASY